MKKKVVAFIPIKLSNQRLPGKNLLPLAGKPLCWYIFDALLNVSAIDEIYTFCSDEEIVKYIPNDVKFLKRDKCLDQDQVKGFEIYDSFIREVDSHIYILAHATSPFTKPDSVQKALNQVLSGDFDSAFAAQRIQSFVWYNGLPLNYSLTDVPRTQDLKAIYVETSGFFIFEKAVFTENRRRIGFKPYMQEVDNIEAIDIDEKKDYDLAKLIAETYYGK